MEIWARLRYNRCVVQQYDPSRRLVMLSTPDGDELIPLPQEILNGKVSSTYISPDVDNLVYWKSFQVNEVIDDEGYMYWIPHDFKESGKYFLIPCSYFYENFKDPDKGIFAVVSANEKIESGDIDGLLVRMIPPTLTETVTGMPIDGWSITGRVSGAIDNSGSSTSILKPKALVDPKRIDSNLLSKSLKVYIYYETGQVDLAIEARHLTIFYKK